LGNRLRRTGADGHTLVGPLPVNPVEKGIDVLGDAGVADLAAVLFDALDVGVDRGVAPAETPLALLEERHALISEAHVDLGHRVEIEIPRNGRPDDRHEGHQEKNEENVQAAHGVLL